MVGQCRRFQIAVLGKGCVGKTSILKKYLYGTFPEKHEETVEETYIQPYNIDGENTAIDYIDTAGSIQFPAMQAIYMQNAKGFVLVYSIDDIQSFHFVQKLLEDIKRYRKNLLEIPCIIIGNNLDREQYRQVETFDALTWACNENLGGCFVEVSAKEATGIKLSFDILLEQIGNKRAEATGSFRLRSTSFNRCIADLKDGSNIAKLKKQRLSKGEKLTREEVSPSSKTFQNTNFVDYKQSIIYKIITSPRPRSKSCGVKPSTQKTVISDKRRVSLPAASKEVEKTDATAIAKDRKNNEQPCATTQRSRKSWPNIFGSLNCIRNHGESQ